MYLCNRILGNKTFSSSKIWRSTIGIGNNHGGITEISTVGLTSILVNPIPSAYFCTFHPNIYYLSYVPNTPLKIEVIMAFKIKVKKNNPSLDRFIDSNVCSNLYVQIIMFYPFPRSRLLSFKNCGNASTNNYFIYKTIIIQENSELKLPMFTLWNRFIEKK